MHPPRRIRLLAWLARRFGAGSENSQIYTREQVVVVKNGTPLKKSFFSSLRISR
jgi:hypothetical protein